MYFILQLYMWPVIKASLSLLDFMLAASRTRERNELRYILLECAACCWDIIF